MRVKSFAKVNLGIEILRKRDDGYHDIRTLFQSIDLHDLMDFFPCASHEVILKGDDDSILWDESNLIHKAATLLKKCFAIKAGVKIHVTKRIPAGKGLGGGSSNAAMTLWALNDMWRMGLEEETLKSMGAHLGSDIPFFSREAFVWDKEKEMSFFQRRT